VRAVDQAFVADTRNGVALRLCCMEITRRALALARVYSRNANADGLPKVVHAVEGFDRNCNFSFTPSVIA